MGKKKQAEVLIKGMEGARYGESEGHRGLFLPRFLAGDADDFKLRDAAQERAHEIIIRWADLELSGKLGRKKETSLQGEFLTEVFGEGLGYVLFSANEKQWHLEREYSVNGVTADGALGLFEGGRRNKPRVLIELKGPTTNIDKDRFNGRTPVQQCWDYLNAVPECPWGVVSNYVSFRLFHRDHTPRRYAHFALQDLRKKRVFEQFYYLFERRGLLPVTAGQRPRADLLLERTIKQQSEVGDVLYKYYHENRVGLIRELCGEKHGKGLDEAISIAQKLIDRIIFIAFCEDRGLLPARLLNETYNFTPPFQRATNPRWRNFLELFRSVDEGGGQGQICGYNGGLFREDPTVDGLELDDDWTDFFKGIGDYDFHDEVNVEVLGHLFERSVRDLERIKTGGLFEAEAAGEGKGKMGKSAERKRMGIYYTPKEFTEFIVTRTIGELIEERFRKVAQEKGLALEESGANEPSGARADLWRGCLEALRGIKVVYPACGSGAFLIQAYELLEQRYLDVIEHLIYHEGEGAADLRDEAADIILRENLYGVDVSAEAVEITQLALWIRTARKGRTLADLSGNIVWGNSLVADAEVHPRALVWEEAFWEVFSREAGGFDCVIGNPPWERMKVQEREFFDVARPDIAAAVNAATRRKLTDKLEKDDPELFERYEAVKGAAERTLDYVRGSGRFEMTGKGDINTYSCFAELAYNIVSQKGRVGILTPTGIATDHTTRRFFAALVENKSLIGLYDFENRKKIFPDVDGRFKFCVLLFGGKGVKKKSADFVFFAHRMEDLADRQRHIKLTAEDFGRLNPNTRTCPIFRSRRDGEITKGIYKRVPVLVDKGRKEGGNPWGIRFFTMFHQTNDAEKFITGEKLKGKGFKREGALWKKGEGRYLPLYEAKMVQMYDHRAASVVVDETNWMRQGQTQATVLVEHQNPEYVTEPRWWV